MKVVQKSRIKILNLMLPGVTAKCACEMAACKESWSRQAKFGLPCSEYVAYGQYSKGISNFAKGGPLKSVVVPRYALSDAQVSILNSDFPQYYFVSPTGGMMHDHPVSHTRANMARYSVLDNLPRGTHERPRRYLDLHGNPGANAKYNSSNKGIVIETLVELVTPKDYLRRAHWPPRLSDDGVENYYQMGIRDLMQRPDFYDRWDGFVGFHTGYYYTADDFGCLFAICPEAKVLLTMHKFPSEEGKLAHGEQHWKKFDQDGVTMVEQFNTKGSGKYTHPDNAKWFTHSCGIIDRELSYTWDASLVCEETYLFQVVALPTRVARLDSGCVEPAPAPPTANDYHSDMIPTASFVRDGRITYRANSRMHSEFIGAGEAAYFDELRLHMYGKERSVDRLRDLLAKAKTLVQGVQKKYDLPVDRSMPLALAAFYVDLEQNSVVLPTLLGEMAPQREALRTMFAGETSEIGLLDKFDRWFERKMRTPYVRDWKIKHTLKDESVKNATPHPTEPLSNTVTQEPNALPQQVREVLDLLDEEESEEEADEAARLFALMASEQWQMESVNWWNDGPPGNGDSQGKKRASTMA